MRVWLEARLAGSEVGVQAGKQGGRTDILQQHRDAKLDCILQGAHVVAVCGQK